MDKDYFERKEFFDGEFIDYLKEEEKKEVNDKVKEYALSHLIVDGKRNKGVTWRDLVDGILHEFPTYFDGYGDYDKRREHLRSMLKVLPEYKLAQEELTDQKVLDTLMKKRKISEHASILNIASEELASTLSRLIDEGFNIKMVGDIVWLETNMISDNVVVKQDYNGETEVTIGLISDTHLCNKKQQLTYLKKYYSLCKELGIKDIYHCGDITDGFYKNRPEHIYELCRIGADDQAEYVVKNYPKVEGIKTHFLTGNHDSTHVKNGGSDIGKMIASRREDMEYLGYMSAKVWLTPKCDMDLFHPLDGVSYATSYSPQRYIDGLSGGQKPKILAIGHYHKNMYFVYRNIHTLLVPCFEAQTYFEKGKKIQVSIGGWIVKVRCDSKGTITSFTTTLVPYLEPIEEDY